VDRHDGRRVQMRGHRVVGAVPNVGAKSRRHATTVDLFPSNPRWARSRRDGVYFGVGRNPGPAMRVVGASDEHEREIGSTGKGTRQLGRVHAGADRTVGDGRDIEDNTHRGES